MSDAECREQSRSAVAVTLLGVSRVAGARPAVHGLVPAALTLGCSGGLGRLGTRRRSGRRHRCLPHSGCLAAGGAAGAVPGVLGFPHRPLGIKLAHRRLTAVSLRRLTDAAAQRAGQRQCQTSPPPVPLPAARNPYRATARTAADPQNRSERSVSRLPKCQTNGRDVDSGALVDGRAELVLLRRHEAAGAEHPGPWCSGQVHVASSLVFLALSSPDTSEASAPTGGAEELGGRGSRRCP